jgi:hypothetical protein
MKLHYSCLLYHVPDTVALEHRNLASAGTSHSSCRRRGHDKRDNLYIKISFVAQRKQCASIRKAVNMLK